MHMKKYLSTDPPKPPTLHRHFFLDRLTVHLPGVISEGGGGRMRIQQGAA